MKIINLSYECHPNQKDAAAWIRSFAFFYGIWEQVATAHEVIFLEFIGVDEVIRSKGVTYLFRKCSPAKMRLPFGLHRYIRRQRPDVVVVHGILFPLQVWLLRRSLGSGVKIIQQHHAGHPLRSRSWLQRLTSRSTDGYWFTGSGLADEWINRGLIPADRVREVMEVSSVFKQYGKEEARLQTGMGEGLNYLWVGRLNANKDPLLLVRAFLEFAAGRRDIRLYMIYQEDDLLPEIRAVLLGHPAADAIVLVGKVGHASLEQWYNAADFFVSCSRYEGSGVAVCEAMSCGCIPLLTDIPSFRYMTGGVCGILYPPGEEKALYAALEATAAMDLPEARDRTSGQYHRHLSAAAIAARICYLLEG